MSTATANIDRAAVAVELRDVSAPALTTVLYSSGDASAPRSADELVSRLEFGGRTWELHVAPSVGGQQPQSWGAWLVLVLGLLFSALFGAFQVLAADRAAQVERMVALRTVELCQANERLELVSREAAAASRAKSVFLANMSHEIRTPMNGVIGMAGVLLDSDLSSSQREFAETIRSSGEALLTVIGDILDFSKIEAGKVKIHAAEFELRELLEDTLSLLAMGAHAKRLELLLQIDPAVPAMVKGDAVRIRQVLTNLVGNAIKFTDCGAVVVSVSLERESAGEVVARYEVRDTGWGIPDEVKARLFQPFAQADDSTTRRVGGTGLGLAICRRLTGLMGGDIGVDSRPGRGSKFWFTTTLERTTALGRATASTLPRGLRGARVLVVDDSAPHRRLLGQQLRRWGLRPDRAASGREALVRLRSATADAPYRLVLIDFELPDMDGLELASRIHAESGFAPPRLVLMTTTPMASPERVDATLTKPLREAALVRCIRSLLTGERKSVALPRSSPAAVALPPPPLRAERILIAEDNPINRRVLFIQLEKLGFPADFATNGREAVAAVADGVYAFVFMDCQMPEMDGYDATREIRRCEGGMRHIPIVALTANALESDREECLAAGMDDYLSKPVRPVDLTRLLARWLPADGGPATAAVVPEEPELVGSPG